MNQSQTTWGPTDGAPAELWGPCLPLFAPDNTAGIVPQPPFTLINSPGTTRLFIAVRTVLLSWPLAS